MNVHPTQPDPRDRPARLTVGVVGAGRVGPALAAALPARRAPPGRRLRRLRRLRAPRRRTCCPTSRCVTPAEVLARADLVLLTVPDDALPGLVEGLAETGAVRPGTAARAHLRAVRHAVLDPALRAGALPLALHPAMTFTGTPVDVQRLAGCSFGVTAPEELRLAAEALVIEMGGEPEWIAEESRPLYHAALALGANHLVTLVAQSMELLRTAGRRGPRPDARPAARRRPRQRPALRRRGADRPGRPRRRGHGRRARRRAAQARARRPSPATWRWPAPPPTARSPTACSSPNSPRTCWGSSPTAPTGPGDRGRDPMTTALLRTADELHARARAGRRAVVMTMGALHEGHATLIRTARAVAGADGEVVVTVFVNPLQFGAGEDLDRYPRTLDADLEDRRAGRRGRRVRPVRGRGLPRRRAAGPDRRRAPWASAWRAPSRPGHFDGMLTVVAKLLHLTRPDVALFGQKDAQQLALIRRMVRDLNFGVEIVGVPTVREEDGLALSSRNRYLSADRAAHRARPVPGAVRGPRPARRPGGAARPGPRGARHARACRGPQRARRVPGRGRRPRRRQGRRPAAPPAVRAAARLVLDEAARVRAAARPGLPRAGRPVRLHRRRATTSPARPSSPSPPGSARPG